METNQNPAQQAIPTTPTPAGLEPKPQKKGSCFKTLLKVIGGIVVVLIVLAITQLITKKNQTPTNTVSNTTTNNASGTPTPAPSATHNNIVIGVEYAFPGTEKAFSEMGITGVKFYPEEYYQWDKMQKSAKDAINFTSLDDMVRRYQNAGMTNIDVGLRYDAKWASKDGGSIVRSNGIPKPQYQAAYEKWLTSVIERYDGDGKDDMPGLRAPIVHYEIGVEYSSYVPEPSSEYVPFLIRSYTIAHAAFPKVQIAHAAFLLTNIFNDNPGPAQYANAFDTKVPKGNGKKYADITAILDHPEAFDVFNIHALEDPALIDNEIAWAKYEMKKRGYEKPIIISDTAPSPFIAWGRADVCSGVALGTIVYPATEADRCRIAAYFSKLGKNDAPSVAFVRGLNAEDMVKKVIVAASNGVVLIDTSFTEDLAILKGGLTGSGSGNMAWGGIVDTSIKFLSQERTVKGKFPAFYAIQQIQEVLKFYDSIERVPTSNSKVRLYKVKSGSKTTWIAWLDPQKVNLPGDTIPKITVSLPELSGTVHVKRLITGIGETIATQTTANGAYLELTPTPVFLTR